MSKAIEELLGKLEEKESEVRKIKEVINQLCELDGKPAMFSDVGKIGSAGLAAIRSDQFYGKPLATAAREVLEMRKAANRGAASVDDLYEALRKGAFKFDAKDEETAKRGLSISLAKNTSAFHRLPNGDYGLVEWYPAITPKKRGGSAVASTTPIADALIEKALPGGATETAAKKES